MTSLRFLLVHRNPAQSEEIAARLARANHTVLPASGLEEAVDALTLERFDAVLMASEFRQGERKHGLEEFSAQLRRMERAQRFPTRVPVIALATEANENTDGYVDAVIPEPIDPEALTTAVSQLSRAVGGPGANALANGRSSLEILEPERFREQVGFDTELMVEIIDLFMEERQRQEPEMRTALADSKFKDLCRLAHTIKGSLGSLHAERARATAQLLELAAKDANSESCRSYLAALIADLEELEPALLALRQA